MAFHRFLFDHEWAFCVIQFSTCARVHFPSFLPSLSTLIKSDREHFITLLPPSPGKGQCRKPSVHYPATKSNIIAVFRLKSRSFRLPRASHLMSSLLSLSANFKPSTSVFLTIESELSGSDELQTSWTSSLDASAFGWACFLRHSTDVRMWTSNLSLSASRVHTLLAARDFASPNSSAKLFYCLPNENESFDVKKVSGFALPFPSGEVEMSIKEATLGELLTSIYLGIVFLCLVFFCVEKSSASPPLLRWISISISLLLLLYMPIVWLCCRHRRNIIFLTISFVAVAAPPASRRWFPLWFFLFQQFSPTIP